MKLRERVIAFLKENEGKQYTSSEIAEYMIKTFPDDCKNKLERSNVISSDADLQRRIAGEVGALYCQRQQFIDHIKTVETRPRKYYYSEMADSTEVENAEAEKTISSMHIEGNNKLTEADLYHDLDAFLENEFRLHSKRIDEKCSSNNRGKNGNKWLHPDIVAMEDLTNGWDENVKKCMQFNGDRKVRLWSFEVKLLINSSNVREVYFQAVSNSSWANIGYLATAEIGGRNTLNELRMLFGLHGIGVIQINADNPIESEILIPARERSEVDWKTVNRLVTENGDYKTYIKNVHQFCQTGDLRKDDWNIRTQVKLKSV